MIDLFGLSGKVALVVGGGQGIGAATAHRLSLAGCAVAVADLELERAQAVVAQLHEAGGRAVALQADILESGAGERLIEQSIAGLGGFDILVTIVGAAKFGSVIEVTEAEWDRDQDRNLRYFYFLCQAAARSFIRRKMPGTIVGMASAGGIGAMPFRSAYGAAKAALIHLVRSLSVELGGYGIRINAVAPGLTVTPRTAARMGVDHVQAEIARIPLGRLGTPEDVANVILFYASELSGHVTGTTLVVDGGAIEAPPYDLGPSRAASERNRKALGIDLGPGADHA
ncbi:SDR family NAD(P)-dependent oxidoreductase [Sphingobium sp. Sx8-8]|uniref:SDR family NAD(P)-dependent oxidoreductase n=1 Tax=Sphingobium sp. Sx8-8 TaxID=2933617 RepID=UPI001F56A81B|nr:SDR family NAD(P)-dependent oxidoreductase [Sphingobium sp. Sx8-8]